MTKRSGMVLGGLLMGLGKGLEMNAAQIREDALLKLREQMVIDAEGRQETRTIAGEQRRGEDLPGKAGLLGLTSELRRGEENLQQGNRERLLEIGHGNKLEEIGATGEQTRQTEAVKAANARDLEAFKFENTKQLEGIKADIENGQVQSVKTGADGAAVVTYNDGHTVRIGNANLQLSSDDDDGSGGAIADAQARRNGTTPAAGRGGTAANASSAAPAAVGLPSDNALFRANPGDAAPKQQIQSGVDRLLSSGQLRPGEGNGQTATIPAGMIAPEPVTVTWDGRRWVY